MSGQVHASANFTERIIPSYNCVECMVGPFRKREKCVWNCQESYCGQSSPQLIHYARCAISGPFIIYLFLCLLWTIQSTAHSLCPLCYLWSFYNLFIYYAYCGHPVHSSFIMPAVLSLVLLSFIYLLCLLWTIQSTAHSLCPLCYLWSFYNLFIYLYFHNTSQDILWWGATTVSTLCYSVCKR